ncbi:hypothetical protein [Spirobacillus cienkowskii]|uniref:hypothetical protein n=1 Tax=Spirobacillus cienkowskii TaxID=495820 RepID=UPI0030D3F790
MINYFFTANFIIVILLVTSCSFFHKATLTVNVENSGMPVENSLVTLYSVGKYRSDPFKITEVVTPKNGLVKLQLDFSKIEILKIVVQNHNIETLYYPEIKYLNPPKWWQDHDLVLNIKLSSWKLKHQAINNKFIQQEMPLIPIFDFPDIPLTDSISIDQMEATLLPEQSKEILSFSSKIQSNFNKNLHEYKKFNNESFKTIVNNKNVLFEEALNIAITAKGLPLEGAHVFAVKNASQSIIYLGSSDTKGMLNVSIPTNRRVDSFIFKKPSYVTVLKPLSAGSGKKSFSVEMQEGITTEFLLQSFAYGIGRGFDKSKLLANGLKLDVSGLSGFVVTQKPIDEKVQIEIEQNLALPQKIDSKTLVKSLSLNTVNNNIPTIYVSSITPYKPAIGLVEPILSGELQTHQSWRRLRREFFTRFMNDFSIRGMIFDDVLKMANSIALSPYQMAKTGWAHTTFASELDVLMEIKYLESEEENDFTLAGLIYDKSGKIIFEQNMPIKNEAESEKVAAKMYQNLISNLPIEGHIIKKENDNFTLNLGKLQSVIEGDQFVAFGQKHSYAPPDKPIAILQVKSVSDKESIMTPITGKEILQTTEVVRVIRYPEKIIQKDFQTQVAQVQ